MTTSDETSALIPAPTVDVPPRAIRMRMGDAVLAVRVSALSALLDEHMPAFLRSGEGLSMKHRTARTLIKGSIPAMLGWLGDELTSANEIIRVQMGEQYTLPLPDLKARHPDLLRYAVEYGATLVLSLMSVQEWQAEYVADADETIWITGLSAGRGTVAAALADPERSAAEPAHHDDTGDAVAASGAGPTSESRSASAASVAS